MRDLPGCVALVKPHANGALLQMYLRDLAAETAVAEFTVHLT